MRGSKRVMWALLLAGCWLAAAGQVATTTVQGTVYRADGTAASGTLLVSWPQFTTAANQAVAAGSTTVAIRQDGFVSLQLAANTGASPAGSYYTAVYHLKDGTVSREYWVVPAAGTASIASVRARLEPATVAVQSATKQYVDTAVSSITGNYLQVSGGTMGGPLVLGGDPTAANQAATKHYIDGAIAGTVQKGGDTMSGPLKTPDAVNKLPRVDVRHTDFAGGADPTGQKDSTAAFQAAIAYAISAQQASGTLSYPVVYCAPGRYLINGTLRLPDTLHLIGDGRNACRLVETNATANLITVYPPSSGLLGGSSLGSIEGLSLEGSGHTTTGTLLEVDDSPQFSVSNLKLYNNGGRGLVLNGSSERFSSVNLNVEFIRWPITLSSDENESYFFNTQVPYPGQVNEPQTAYTSYCYSINCVNGVFPAANAGPGGAATPITPDPHPAIYVGDAVNVRFIGGSLKPLKYVGGFQLFSTSVSDISSFYCEGYPVYPYDNSPRLNACVTVGGAARHTTLTAALSGSGSSVPLSDVSWMPEYYGDPADATAFGSNTEYVILPADYLSGSTAASTAAPGIQRGQYEIVSVSGFAGDGKVYFSGRNQSGSTAPANTQWPAGSVIEQIPGPYGAYGTVTLDEDHINAIQPPSTGYTDNCDQTGTKTCAELIFGFEPDGLFYDPLGGANPVTNQLNTFVNMDGDEMFSGSYAHMGEIALHGFGSYVIKGNGKIGNGETAEVTASSGTALNLGNITGGSHMTAPTYANGVTAQASVRIPSANATWITKNGGASFYRGESLLYSQGGGYNNVLYGSQFANQYCWFDVPSTGTQPGMRFCLNGGPKNGSNQGLEYDQWNGSKWVNAFHVIDQGTVKINGGLAISTVLNTAASLTLGDSNKTVLANASSGAQTLTLTDCSGTFSDGGARTGQEFTVVKTDGSANAVTVKAVGTQTISYDGTAAASMTIGSPGARTMVCGPDHNWYAY